MAALLPSALTPAAASSPSPLPLGLNDDAFPPLQSPAPGSVRRLAASFMKGMPSVSAAGARAADPFAASSAAAAATARVSDSSTEVDARVSPSMAAVGAADDGVAVATVAAVTAEARVPKNLTSAVAAPVSFAAVVKPSNIPMHHFNSFYPTTMKGDALSLSLPEDIFESREQLFSKTAMIGRIMLRKGENPRPALHLHAELQSVWNLKKPWRLVTMGKGFYTLRFTDSSDLAAVRKMTTVNLSGGSFSVRKWSPNFDPKSLNGKMAQIWVRIKNLPYFLGSPEIVASVIRPVGQPLEIDGVTVDGHIGLYVRVLVDVDMSKDLVTELWLDRGTKSCKIEFEYENRPLFCPRCQMVGHSLSNCRRHNSQKGKVTEGRRPEGVADQRPVKDEARAAKQAKEWIVVGAKSTTITRPSVSAAAIQGVGRSGSGNNQGSINKSASLCVDTNKFAALSADDGVDEEMEMELPPAPFPTDLNGANSMDLPPELDSAALDGKVTDGVHSSEEQPAAPANAIAVGMMVDFDTVTKEMEPANQTKEEVVAAGLVAANSSSDGADKVDAPADEETEAVKAPSVEGSGSTEEEYRRVMEWAANQRENERNNDTTSEGSSINTPAPAVQKRRRNKAAQPASTKIYNTRSKAGVQDWSSNLQIVDASESPAHQAMDSIFGDK